MRRYYSHTVILPDETHLDDFVVEVNGTTVTYFPFMGEIHSTIYVEHPLLISNKPDLQGKKVTLQQLAWALGDAQDSPTLYTYSLTPCPSCSEGWYVLTKL